MESLVFTLHVAGIAISAIGSIWFLIVAFCESILWGLGCLFIPFIALIFLILHWREAAKPFIVSLIGSVLIVAVEFMAPETTTSVLM